MIRSHRLFLVSTLFLAGSAAAHGWMRPVYEDATVVERSELIVVGRLSGEPIQEVLHKRAPEDGQSWEYHATLVISEVLKGKAPGEKIPIVIHYGLSPGSFLGNDRIGIYDSGNSVKSFSPLIADAQADNLWFLRRRAGIYGDQPGTGAYGIVDPEDVQPLEWKDYFLCFLSPDPDAELEAYAHRNPDKGSRAEKYLKHLEVQRILKIEDPGERFDKLQPYFLDRVTWNDKSEARDGILSCGPLAGERLKRLFSDPRYQQLRTDIIRLWWEMGYRDAAPLLISLLKKHDRYWKRQHFEKGWWSDFSEEGLRRQKIYSEIYSEVYAAVYTLRKLRDPRAKEALKATRDRWREARFENTQIAEECEAALRELAKLEKAAPAR